MKRLFDVLVSACLLVLAAPLIVALAVAIKITDRGPVVYSAERAGRYGRKFRMYKFRSMIVDADRGGASSTPADDPRITRIGRWMRTYKLDELPQLFNVLIGDMSLVGPRPQVQWAVNQYSPEERLVLKVRPGITDPASLRFANEAEILRGSPDPDRTYMEVIHPEKMRLSLQYVSTRSFIGDLHILFKTVKVALYR